ncbi:MAG TPA: KOW domain-containing RNA-binding protein [Candidatus Fimicola cottocaccae]|nr:KOW domain-containing RNA-binding protein [Candidatus Fimicola cottocaccae]
MEFTAGQIVFSKSGHDKGGAFIVIDIEEEFLYIVDGKRRTLEKPKRKKIKHVQKTNYVDNDIKDKIENESYILDADIVKALKKYINN